MDPPEAGRLPGLEAEAEGTGELCPRPQMLLFFRGYGGFRHFHSLLELFNK